MGVFDHQVGFAVESTWGTAVTPTRFLSWRSGGGLQIVPQPVRSNAMRTGRRSRSADLSTRRLPDITGTFSFDVETKGAGLLLRAIFGTVATTGPTSGKYTHTFTLGSTELPGLTWQQGIGRPGAVSTMPFTAIGTKVASATIAGAVGENVGVTVNLDAREVFQYRQMTGTTTSGNAVVASITSTLGLMPRMPVSGTGIPASTTILSVDSATQITLSANATASGSPTLTFGIALATATYPAAPNEAFLVDNITVTLGAVALCASSFEVSINHGIKTDRQKMCGGGLKDEQIRAQFGDFKLSLSGVEYVADTQMDRMLAISAANAQAQAIITCSGQSDPTNKLIITIPVAEMIGDFPTINDMLVETDLKFDILTPTAGGSEITAAYTTLDTTP
jgi:hypothetical protein